MAETAETVNSIRGQRVLKNVQFDVACLRNRWPVCVSIDLRNAETAEDPEISKMGDLSDFCVSKLQRASVRNCLVMTS